MGSVGFFIAGIVILALVAAGVGFYLYQRKGIGDTARLFASRTRRLAYVERTALEGGRKLLLVRRDDVEHLILIGGPIDLVVESGIRSEGFASPSAKEASAAPAAFAPSVWPLADSLPDVEPAVAPEPHLPIFPKAKEAEKAPIFGPMPEVKAAGQSASSRVLKNDVARGLTVSPPNRDKLTMKAKPLKTRDPILSLSKDEAKISYFFSSLQEAGTEGSKIVFFGQ